MLYKKIVLSNIYTVISWSFYIEERRCGTFCNTTQMSQGYFDSMHDLAVSRRELENKTFP